MSSQLALPLVADIGGTHIRLALVRQSSQQPLMLHNISKKCCRDYATPVDAIQEYVKLNECKINAMCLAVAGAINGNQVTLTNHPWNVNQQHIQHVFRTENVRIVNDFYAQAMAIPYLSNDELLPISPVPPQNHSHANRLIIGPGTGLGMASLLSTSSGWQAIPGEGGHADFAPNTVLDQQIVSHFHNEQQLARISVENILSGRGLERLYQAHYWIKHHKYNHKVDRDIIQQAISDHTSTGYKVIQHFCTVLGAVSGNAALTLGARNGVYITGGLIPRFMELFKLSQFRTAFENKQPLESYMQQIPTYLVLADQPGLLGAAAIISCQQNHHNDT